MNRAKRFNKSFISGGVLDPNMPFKQQQNVNQQGKHEKDEEQKLGQEKRQKREQAQEIAANSQQNMSPIKVEELNEPEAKIKDLVEPQSGPVVQQNIVTAAATQEFNEVDTLDKSSIVDENGKVKFRKIFGIRKKASVRAKEKRVRQNRRLRKTIIPKNALMALHEVKGLTISDFTVSSNTNGGFTATVTVNQILYEGQGISKVAAKNNASEKALRDYIIAKMQQSPRTIKNGGTSSAAGSICNDDAMEATEESSDIHDDKDEDGDDVPMVNLASFALYKLFSEWEREGYSVPELHPARGITSDNESNDIIVKESKKPPKRDELPSNWQSMHPASLLCVMRPGVTYIDKGRTGTKPNEIQLMAVVVDDHEFMAEGRSKKTARHNVATVVCNTLFNTNFTKIESSVA